MTLSPVVAQWAAIYEQENGRKPDKLMLEIAEHIMKVAKKLTDRGHMDAQQGKSAYPATVFPELVVKAFRLGVDEDHETVQAVADLWQAYYMDGYRKGGKV